MYKTCVRIKRIFRTCILQICYFAPFKASTHEKINWIFLYLDLVFVLKWYFISSHLLLFNQIWHHPNYFTLLRSIPPFLRRVKRMHFIGLGGDSKAEFQKSKKKILKHVSSFSRWVLGRVYYILRCIKSDFFLKNVSHLIFMSLFNNSFYWKMCHQ